MVLLERCALRLKTDGRRLVRRVFFAPDPLVAALRWGWVALIVWGEIGVFFWALSGCRWPSPVSRPHEKDHQTHVLLIADAQLPDPHALATVDSTAYVAELAHAVYVRRAWRATRRMRPHVVLFLGDMLKSGRYVHPDDEFTEYVEHFTDFFVSPLGQGVEVRYIPGNADVGLGIASAFSKHVRQRYERHFGRANMLLTTSNHSLVLLDAPGIVDEDYMRAGHGTTFEEWIPLRDGAIEFVKGLASEEHPGPNILFSHIPLHRAESKQCGPLRERGTIHRGVGHGWQKTLGKQTSAFLLESLRPTIVFSADDRDYCDVTHTLPQSGTEIHEITVKSFSPARHISHPGFHLLSLAGDTAPSPVHAHAPCLLPQADGTFTRLYIPALVLTVLVLLITHMRRANRAARLRLTTPASPLPSHTDPKWPHPPTPVAADALPTAPSPYSASSAYSYSYAYSNTPPTKGSQQQPRRAGPPAPLVLAPIMQEVEEEQDDNDAVRAHYLYMPPASPVPGDLLARRAARGSSPDRGAGAPTAATGPSAREWLFSYSFTWRGRRRRVALQAPKWWPRRGGGTVGGAAGRRRRRREEVWSAAGRDFGRAIGPAILVWVVLLWLY